MLVRNLNRWKVKPPMWGPPSLVQRAMFDNAERIYGIDPATIGAILPLWECGGNKIFDLNAKRVESGFLGDLQNDTTWKGDKLYFDGINDYVKLAIWDGQGIISFFSRFKSLKNIGSVEQFTSADSYGDSKRTFQFRRHSSGVLHFIVFVSNTAKHIYGNTTLTTDEWWNVGAVNDGTNSHLYVNGKSDATPVVTGNMDNDSACWALGASSTKTDWSNIVNDLHGYIDFLYRFDTALTADQMAMLHDRPYALFEPVRRPSYHFFIPIPYTKTILVPESSAVNLSLKTLNYLAPEVAAAGKKKWKARQDIDSYAAMSTLGGFVLDESVALSSLAAITNAALGIFNKGFSLSSLAAQSQAGMADCPTSMTLSSSADQSQNRTADMPVGLSLSSLASQLQAATMDAQAALALSSLAQQLQAVTLETSAGVSLDATASFLEDYLASFVKALGLDVNIDISLLAQMMAEKSLSLGSVANIVLDAEAIGIILALSSQASFNISTTQIMTALSSLNVLASVSFDYTYTGAAAAALKAIRKVSKHHSPLLRTHDRKLVDKHDKTIL